MPAALPRACASPGCGGSAESRGRCIVHARAERGSTNERGYTSRWRRFRERFIAALVAHGIAPTCGAALPGGPVTDDSRCKAEGLIVFAGLHLDHEPPLQPIERQDARAVCDAKRVQLLCRRCHSVKTARQGAAWGEGRSDV